MENNPLAISIVAYSSWKRVINPVAGAFQILCQTMEQWNNKQWKIRPINKVNYIWVTKTVIAFEIDNFYLHIIVEVYLRLSNIKYSISNIK